MPRCPCQKLGLLTTPTDWINSAGLGEQPLNWHYTFKSGVKMIDLNTLLAGLDFE